MPVLRQRALHSLFPLILTETLGGRGNSEFTGKETGSEGLDNLHRCKGRRRKWQTWNAEGGGAATVKTGSLLTFVQPLSGQRELGLGIIAAPSLWGCMNCGPESQTPVPCSW